jgi:hypothetical protein
MRLSNISGAKVLLVAAARPVLLLVAWGVALVFSVRSAIRESGEGGLAAIGFGADPIVVVVLMGPPIGLVVAWAAARWIARRPPAA